ncbi:hypothetical protein POM88_021759 [Heracleum sosnowskyi]|uniref:Uncharacterized protein n=1 Tax=Heracleum sosnowskyi TaxID=360622 RepID=A0AAD8IE01_9APIA|nr:hypothetical protein POM88_021759 [Heracleum sosnowskyi]
MDAQSAINELNSEEDVYVTLSKWLGSRQIRCNWAAKGAGADDKQNSDVKSVVELTSGTSGYIAGDLICRIPEIRKNGKIKKIKAFQIQPLRDAPVSWYTTEALQKIKEHGFIYLIPFSHRLAEEIDIRTNG